MKTEILVAIIGAIALIAGIILSSVISGVNRKKQAKKNSKEKEWKFILKKLNDFFYPLRNYLEFSKSYYDMFIKDKPSGFRTLPFLLDPNQVYEGNVKVSLSNNDKVVLQQILKIGSDIEKLIVEKSAIVDDKEFIGPYIPSEEYSNFDYPDKEISLLSLLKLHLSAIRLAFEGDLTGEKEYYSKFVFPRELNKRVTAKILQLKTKVDILGS